MKKLCLALLTWTLIASPLMAQDVVSEYLRSASGTSVIYHGKEQVQYLSSIKYHPYFKSADYTLGRLLYDGIEYKDVNMRYDIYRGELLLLSPDNRFNVILPSDRLSYAIIHGYRLEYIDPDGSSGDMPRGYYFILHDGDVDLLAYCSCRLNHEVKGMEHIDYFEQSTRYYVRIDGKCHHVRGKRSILALFKSHKRELSQFIKSEKLSFRSSLEQSLVQVLKHYEHLNKGL